MTLTMRIWSEQRGTYIEAESVWNGRDSLFPFDTRFQVRESYLTRAAVDRGDPQTRAAAREHARDRLADATAKQELAEQAITNMDTADRQTRRAKRIAA